MRKLKLYETPTLMRLCQKGREIADRRARPVILVRVVDADVVADDPLEVVPGRDEVGLREGRLRLQRRAVGRPAGGRADRRGVDQEDPARLEAQLERAQAAEEVVLGVLPREVDVVARRLEVDAAAEPQLVELALVHGDDDVGQLGLRRVVLVLHLHRREDAEVVDAPARVLQHLRVERLAVADVGVLEDELGSMTLVAADVDAADASPSARDSTLKMHVGRLGVAIDVDLAFDVGPGEAEPLQLVLDGAFLLEVLAVVEDVALLELVLELAGGFSAPRVRWDRCPRRSDR